jgi:hypothetical protein
MKSKRIFYFIIAGFHLSLAYGEEKISQPAQVVNQPFSTNVESAEPCQKLEAIKDVMR